MHTVNVNKCKFCFHEQTCSNMKANSTLSLGTLSVSKKQ